MVVCEALSGLHDVLRETEYDGFVLDVFGVLIDGQKAFPAAIEAVRKLRERGAKLVVLSNSSRRSETTVTKLEALGFEKSLFDSVLTSGEMAHTFLLNQVSQGSNVCHFNWSKRGAIDLSAYPIRTLPSCVEYEGTLVPDINQLDLVLAHGTEGISNPNGTVSNIPLPTLERYAAKIAHERGAEVSFICANPDIVTVDGGELRTMPGKLAQLYSEAGGNVTLLGKPHAYKQAVEELNSLGVSKEKCLGVGDSLHHDILGASSAGIDSLYVAGGINAADFDLVRNQFDSRFDSVLKFSQDFLDKLRMKYAPSLLQENPAHPTHIVPYFRW